MAVITKLENNPNTAIVIPIRNRMNKEHCNNCSFCSKDGQGGNGGTRNFTCTYSNRRVIRLKVYDDEKVEVPFWCPKKKENKTSNIDEEQERKWQILKQKYEAEKRWKQIGGILGWDDIKANACYHYPPSPFHGRMNIRVEVVYPGSLRAINLETKQFVWLYKSDESYKFMSELK